MSLGLSALLGALGVMWGQQLVSVSLELPAPDPGCHGSPAAAPAATPCARQVAGWTLAQLLAEGVGWWPASGQAGAWTLGAEPGALTMRGVSRQGESRFVAVTLDGRPTLRLEAAQRARAMLRDLPEQGPPAPAPRVYVAMSRPDQAPPGPVVLWLLEAGYATLRADGPQGDAQADQALTLCLEEDGLSARVRVGAHAACGPEDELEALEPSAGALGDGLAGALARARWRAGSQAAQGVSWRAYALARERAQLAQDAQASGLAARPGATLSASLLVAAQARQTLDPRASARAHLRRRAAPWPGPEEEGWQGVGVSAELAWTPSSSGQVRVRELGFGVGPTWTWRHAQGAGVTLEAHVRGHHHRYALRDDLSAQGSRLDVGLSAQVRPWWSWAQGALLLEGVVELGWSRRQITHTRDGATLWRRGAWGATLGAGLGWRVF